MLYQWRLYFSLRPYPVSVVPYKSVAPMPEPVPVPASLISSLVDVERRVREAGDIAAADHIAAKLRVVAARES